MEYSWNVMRVWFAWSNGLELNELLLEDIGYYEPDIMKISVSRKDPKLENLISDESIRSANSNDQMQNDTTSIIYHLWKSNNGTFPKWLYKICEDEEGRRLLDEVSNVYKKTNSDSSKSMYPELLNRLNKELGRVSVESKRNLSNDLELPRDKEVVKPEEPVDAYKILRDVWISNGGHFPVWMYNVSQTKKARKLLDDLDKRFRKQERTMSTIRMKENKKKDDVRSRKASLLKEILNLLKLRDGGDKSRDKVSGPIIREEVLREFDEEKEPLTRNVKSLISVAVNPKSKRVKSSTSVHPTESYERRQLSDFVSVVKQLSDMGLTLDQVDSLSRNHQNNQIVSSLDERENLVKIKSTLDRIVHLENKLDRIDTANSIIKLKSLLSRSRLEEPNLTELFGKIDQIRQEEEKLNSNLVETVNDNKFKQNIDFSQT